jgi:DNA-binding CsgD family transcriptional regulator
MLRDARCERLEEAHREALRVGALGLATSIGVNLAAVHVMTARFAQGIDVAQQVERSAARLGLLPLQSAAQLIHGFAMAHQGKGREMESHLRIAESLAPADAEVQSGAWGIGRALFALLQEDRVEARRALVQARLAAPGEHARILNPYAGPELLLRAIAGDLDVVEARGAVEGVVRAARWPALWTYCALAVALGAEGSVEAARTACAAGLEAGRPYPVFLALAQRLVGEAALHDGWCDALPLLRSAEAKFERLGLGRAANACRRLINASGTPAPRRRKRDAPVHPILMAAGVTAREAEVMELLVERLSNREIAERLYLSPRTVEKHVASLLDKLGVERSALAHVARTLR